MERFICKNKSDTQELGKLIAKHSFKGEVITLKGQLGAGKTTFSQGFASGLNIKGVINSPTFNIVKCYFDSLLPLYHIDAYRLEDLHQDLGLEEYIEGDGVCLIEWAEFIKEVIPDELLKIEIEILKNEERVISITPIGNKYIELLKVVKELWDIR
jgi:tRNA threonylcarbamoyladenosine biosynthesis protein TsaE